MLVLVRHGRTEANVDGLLLGRRDVPLDDVGRRQAAAVARALCDQRRRPVDQVITSPLGRARETAEPIAAAAGAPIVIDDRWIELDYGELDGLTTAEVDDQTWAAWRADPTYVVTGGESLTEVGLRVARACEQLASGPSEEDVIVVSHVSPIKAAVAWALGVGQEVGWRTYVAPASITTIGITPRGPVLRSFNETAHLPPTR